MKYKTEHFVLKEDGKIYWIEKVPEKPFNLNPVIQDIGLRQKYERDHFDYQQALQSAISNAVEVSNQKVVHGELFDKYDCRLKTGVVYSLQCSVEKQVIPGIVNKPWFTSLVTFSQPVEEQKDKREVMNELIIKHIHPFSENNLFRSSLEHFMKHGRVSGSFMLALHEMMEEYRKLNP